MDNRAPSCRSETHAAPSRPVHIRRRARAVMDTDGNRLTLCTALLCVITLSLGLLALTDCLLCVWELIGNDRAAWVLTLCNVLVLALAILVVLPLVTAVYRMAVLMVAQADRSECRPVTADVTVDVTAGDCLYPFTSLRAYLRTMLVGLEALIWLALCVLIPVGAYAALDRWLMPICRAHLTPFACRAVALLGVALAVAIGFGICALSCRRAGIGYAVFSHEELSWRQINRSFRRQARPIAPVMWTRLSLTGWVLLSLVLVLVPFVIHTVPYGMLSAAVYGEELWARVGADSDGQAIGESL